MSALIANIQLYKADDKDFEKLTSEMKKVFFYLRQGQQADNLDGKPKGTYRSKKNVWLPDAADAINKAIKKIGRDYSFTIMIEKKAKRGLP